MSNVSKLFDKYCKYAAQEAVNNAKAEIFQSFQSLTDSGPITVVSVDMVDGVITLTVLDQNGRTITGVQPGSNPVGPGTTAIMNAGRKLQ